MNIKKAKEDIKNTVRAYLKKDNYGQYAIPSIRQRPVLLMGPSRNWENTDYAADCPGM